MTRQYCLEQGLQQIYRSAPVFTAALGASVLQTIFGFIALLVEGGCLALQVAHRCAIWSCCVASNIATLLASLVACYIDVNHDRQPYGPIGMWIIISFFSLVSLMMTAWQARHQYLHKNAQILVVPYCDPQYNALS